MRKPTGKLIITFENSGGILDTCKVDNENDAAISAATMIDEAGELHDGDIIRVRAEITTDNTPDQTE